MENDLKFWFSLVNHNNFPLKLRVSVMSKLKKQHIIIRLSGYIVSMLKLRDLFKPSYKQN